MNVTPEPAAPDLTLHEKLERFAMLQGTITGLEADRSAFGDDIKAAMLQGRTSETDRYCARLQTTRKVTSPVDQFRDLYGDAAPF